MSETFLFVLCLSFAGVISGLTGFAFALVASGTLLSLRPPLEATALVLACSILSQAISVIRLRAWPPAQTALVMILPGLVGAPIGTYLLRDLRPDAVKLCVGGFLILYSGTVALLRPDYRVRFDSPVADGTVGFLGGFLGGIAGLSGALPTAWSLIRGWDPRTQRAVYQLFTLVLQIWSFGFLLMLNPVPQGFIDDVSMALPVVGVSVLFGLFLFSKVDQRLFRSILLVLLAVIGIGTMVSPIETLLAGG